MKSTLGGGALVPLQMHSLGQKRGEKLRLHMVPKEEDQAFRMGRHSAQAREVLSQMSQWLCGQSPEGGNQRGHQKIERQGLSLVRSHSSNWYIDLMQLPEKHQQHPSQDYSKLCRSSAGTEETPEQQKQT